MPRKTTKLTAKERRTAAASSGMSIQHDATGEAVVTPDDGKGATRVATPEPGTMGDGANFGPEDSSPNRGLVPAVVGSNPTIEAKPSHYEVVHAAVGGHYKGECIEAGTFTEVQSRRLLAEGAIIPFKWRSEPWN